MKKLLVALLLVAVIASGAFAQLMIGVSGALHMDQFSATEIKNSFQTGDGVFYGGQIEIAGKHLGLGFTANVSSYTVATYVQAYDSNGAPVGLPVYQPAMKFMDYDMTLYLSYHLFGARAFLDPFGEFGGGILATGFADAADSTLYRPYDGSFFTASYYWYGALGLGINLGPIGIFGKFAVNYPIKSSFQANWKGTNVKTDLYPYGYDWFLYPNGYLPKFRFTAGVKLIL